MLGSALAWLGWLWWRTDRLADRHPLRWLLIASATFVVSWLPPVIEQLHPGTGNMRKLYHQFTDPGEPFVGARAAIKAMVGRFNLARSVADRSAERSAEHAQLPRVRSLRRAASGAALWWAWRRREPVEFALFAVLTMATLLGLISTTRIFGTFFEYVIRWMSPLVALWIAAALWSCWRTWQARAPSTAGRPLVTGVAVVGALTLPRHGGRRQARALTAEIPYERDSTITGALSAQLADTLDPTVRYQINEFDPVALGSVAFGLALQLERDGLHAGVGPWGSAGVMPFRVVDDEQAQSTLWYVASKPTIAAFSALPGAVVRASFDVRSADEVQRSDRLEADLAASVVRCRTTRAPRLAVRPLG